jgi:hypothetical protein
MTRSLAALWHGDIILSLRYRPLGIVLFGGAVASCVLAVAPPSVQQRALSKLPNQRVVGFSLLFLLVGVWLARIVLAAGGNGFFQW